MIILYGWHYQLDQIIIKSALMQLNTCSLCGLQFQQHLTVPFDMPLYQPPTDTVKIVNRRTCKQCCMVINNIQYYAEQTQIKFGNHNFKSQIFQYYPVEHAPQPKKAIQLIYATASQTIQKRGSYNQNRTTHVKRLSLTERNFNEQNSQEQIIHPYISLLIDEILQKNYLTLNNFPKTLQFMVYLASLPPSKESKLPQIFVLPEERHQKIKNIVLYLAEKIHVSIQQLPYVLFLTNFLLCLMNPPKVISTIIQLSNLLVACPQLLSWRSLIFQHQRSNSQTPLSPATLDLRAILVQVDKLWLKLQSIIQLGRRGENALREGVIRISKIDLSCDYKEYKKKIKQNLKSLLSKKQELDLLQQYHLSMLYLMKLQRNSFNLILKEAMEEEEQARLQIVHLNHKFKMEKDQFIQKIVKLNNKIETLEKALKELQQHQTVNILQNQQHQRMELMMRQQKMGGMRENPLQMQLQTILTVTDILNFNDKHYTPSAKGEKFDMVAVTITQKVIIQIQKMQETIQRNLHKMRAVEDEKSRLLGIISRKEERLLAVILQKDTIIQRYEQALWTMQNGLQVTQGPLVSRIKYIMHIFSNRQREQKLNLKEKQMDVIKSKAKDKDCQIY